MLNANVRKNPGFGRAAKASEGLVEKEERLQELLRLARQRGDSDEIRRLTLQLRNLIH